MNFRIKKPAREAFLSSVWEFTSSIEEPDTFYSCTHAVFSGTSSCLVSLSRASAVSVPLCTEQAEVLKKRCEQAPFGRREATIVDTTVRKTWQLPPTAFKLRSKSKWEAAVDRLGRTTVSQELGVPEATKVHATLYKLLLYEAGGFFKPHRDTEKEDGMFATLVIVLPSSYEGGQLIVTHKGSKREFDFAAQGNEFECFYAAFFCDCEHEVKPVSSGHRLCLVYNLCSAANKKLNIKNNDALVSCGLQVFRMWADPLRFSKEHGRPHDLPLFAHLLNHQYSPAELSFANLKGRDVAIVQVLKAIPEQVDLVLALAQLRLVECGWVDGDEMVYGELTDIDLWRCVDLDGRPFEGSEEIWLVAHDNLILPADWIAKATPFDEYIEEATGNEGASMERWFSESAVLVWPRNHDLLVRWYGRGDARMMELFDSSQSHPKEKLVPVARYMLEQNQERWGNQWSMGLPLKSPFVEFIFKEGDSYPDLRDICTESYFRYFGEQDGSLLKIFAAHHGLPYVTQRLQKSLPAIDEKRHARSSASAKLSAEAQLADELFKHFTASAPLKVESRVPVIKCACALKRFRIAANILQQIKGREITMNVLQQLLNTSSEGASLFTKDKALELFAQRLVTKVGTRDASPGGQAKIINWKVPLTRVSCTCDHCKVLKRFLSDPDAPSVELRIRKADRGHMHSVCESAGLNHATRRNGNPSSILIGKPAGVVLKKRKLAALEQEVVGTLERAIEG
ncbi:hypothetical protein HK102_001396 [Quaeritorhiza haematococci]|nr:hypothetical protein HK102_001396 [Quaeritorhiza haematococci]